MELFLIKVLVLLLCLYWCTISYFHIEVLYTLLGHITYVLDLDIGIVFKTLLIMYVLLIIIPLFSCSPN